MIDIATKAAAAIYEAGFRYEGPVIYSQEFGVTAKSAQIETMASLIRREINEPLKQIATKIGMAPSQEIYTIAAVALGHLGGKANKGIPKPKSAENGKKGGRPKKPK